MIPKKRYYKWVKYDRDTVPPVIECTKDYLPDGNEHINEANGWTKNLKDYIEIVVKEEADEGKAHQR